MSYLVAAVGGTLIGVASLVVLVASGRVAGVSGMANALVEGPVDWRASFLGGLVTTGFVCSLVLPDKFPPLETSTGVLLVAGLLVGFGTRIGNGCTSGHGVCGLARFSPRSLTATLTFIGFAMATVFLMGGGA